jgi:mono/diheme cytochrome c family protein
VKHQAIFATVFLLSNIAAAQLTDRFRRDNSVVYYDFYETSGDIIDKSERVSPYSAVNLRLHTTNTVQRQRDASVPGAVGSLKFDAPNILRSIGPAEKINRTCKANGALSFEVWLENSESVEIRSGFDGTNAQTRRPHPLRILNLGRASVSDSSTENLYQRNFVFGQFYEMGNIFQIGVRTPTSEPNGNFGRSLTQPFESSVVQTIVPDDAVGRPDPKLQKVIYTVGPSGVQRLYLTDLNGNLYQASEESMGFLGNSSANPANFFSNWFDDSYLSIGNVFMRNSEFATALSQPNTFGQRCDNCEQYKNRFWKGKLRLVAIYCNELTREQVLSSDVVNSIMQNVTNFSISTASAPDTVTQKALDIYSRLTGVKTSPSNPIIDRMVREIVNDNIDAAAAIVTNEDPRFLNITVRDFAAKMSNRDQSVNTPLNDFIATVVGSTRDELDARRLLWDNLTYSANPALAAVPNDMVVDILRSNNHYQALDDARYDLSKVLVQRNQQFLFNGTAAIANPQPSGLLTSRQWMMEHAIAGTNRRLVEYTFKIFLCSPIESVADASGPEDVVGPDIDRVPGGSATKFQTNCRACHTILDGFRPAFARWTFGNGYAKHAFLVPEIGPAADENANVSGMQEYPTIRNISAKVNRNQDVYPDARLVRDDKWVNNAIYNANKVNLAFDQQNPSVMGGSGTQSFGRAIASSKRFGRCMAERVFRQVCKRDVVNSDNTFLNDASAEFMNGANNYNLKFLFNRIVTSTNCLGGQ